MALHNQTLILYLAIDSRLRRKPAPSLAELQEAVKERLDGLEVSKRTVQLAIQNMRQHNGLKFFAPIEAVRTGLRYGSTVYVYADPDYKLAKAIEQNN